VCGGVFADMPLHKRQHVDEEKRRADEEKRRADEEKRRADEEKRRADEEKRRADEERRRDSVVLDKLDGFEAKFEHVSLQLSTLKLSSRQSTGFWVDAFRDAPSGTHFFDRKLPSLPVSTVQSIWSRLWSELRSATTDEVVEALASLDSGFDSEDVLQTLMSAVHAFTLGALRDGQQPDQVRSSFFCFFAAYCM
jgi:hypothetical protein